MNLKPKTKKESLNIYTTCIWYLQKHKKGVKKIQRRNRPDHSVAVWKAIRSWIQLRGKVANAEGTFQVFPT